MPNQNNPLSGINGLSPAEQFISSYRGEMAANFTIYGIQVSSVTNCGYVDKWTVNAEEYFAHFTNTFGVTSLDTTTHGVRKKPQPSTVEDGPEEETPNSDDIIYLSGPMFPYNTCF